MRKSRIISVFLSLLIIGCITFIGSLFTASQTFCNGLAFESLKKEDDNIIVKVHSKPRELKPGESGVITVKIETAKGIKLTKYPQTSVTLSGDEGLTFEKNVMKLGQDKMPEDIKKNLLNKIQPMEFKFKVDKNVDKKMLKVTANISYFYCVSKSGFCAPGTKNIDFQIPVKTKK